MTLLTGLIVAVSGMFPAVTMKLLDFVALYGMILMPMGAVIFVDFWLAGSSASAATTRRRADDGFNWAAGLTWFLTLGVCSCAGEDGQHRRSYFVSLPGWFIAAVLYVVLSRLISEEGGAGGGAGCRRPGRMRAVARTCRGSPWRHDPAAGAFLADRLDLDQVKRG